MATISRKGGSLLVRCMLIVGGGIFLPTTAWAACPDYYYPFLDMDGDGVLTSDDVDYLTNVLEDADYRRRCPQNSLTLDHDQRCDVDQDGDLDSADVVLLSDIVNEISDYELFAGQDDVCGDGVDNECDGSVDENCLPADIALLLENTTTGNPTFYGIGEEIEFTMTIDNNGVANIIEADGYVATVAFPDHFTFVSTTAGCVQNGTWYECPVEVNAGNTQTLTFTFEINNNVMSNHVDFAIEQFGYIA